MKPKRQHGVSEQIHFIPGTNDGPMTCQCGEEMLASEHGAHRKAHGEQAFSTLGPRTVDHKTWNRQYPKAI